MALTAIELETLKTRFNAETRNVCGDRTYIQRRIDNVIQRTQAGDLSYEEAIKLSWKQISLFSEVNVWYLIKNNRVTIAEVKQWGGIHKSTVAHPLIKDRLDNPEVVQWIDIISSRLSSIFDKPQITPLVQRNIIPWDELLQIKYFDDMFSLLINDEVLDFLLHNAFTFEELKTKKTSVVMLAKGWITREELAGYTEKQLNFLMIDGERILSHKKNHGRITASDLLSFNQIQLAFVCHVYCTILDDTRHTAATIRDIPLTVCMDILENYRYARELKLGIYNTEDVRRILNSFNQPLAPVSQSTQSSMISPSAISIFNNTQRNLSQIQEEENYSVVSP